MHLGILDANGSAVAFVAAADTRRRSARRNGQLAALREELTAAQDALAQAAKVEKTAAVSYHIEFDYMNMDSVMRTLKDMDIPQSGQNFGQLCSMDIRVRLSQQEELTKRLVKYLSLIIQNV